MNYLRLFVLMLPSLSLAQSEVTGLGNYIIGMTTPDSLNRTNFREEPQSYVKGTIALPCAHIRTFTSATVAIAGVTVANVVLVFYDNRLFKIAGDYDDPLKMAFLEQHGQGIRKPTSRYRLCTKDEDKPLLMWGETWPGVDVLALAVHRRGYTADCKREEGARLIIASRRMTALSSDCDVKPDDPLVDAFIKWP